MMLGEGRRPHPIRFLFMAIVALVCTVGAFAAPTPASAAGWADKAPQTVIEGMSAGSPQEIIVLFEDAEIQSWASGERTRRGLPHEDDPILAWKSAAYRTVKEEVLATLSAAEVEVVNNYSHLPMAFLRVKSIGSLRALLSHARIVAAYENEQFYPVLTQSLPLIKQPQTAAAGMTGAGTAVAVLDTGLNYTESVFGACTGGNTPGDCLSLPSTISGCRVACVHDFAPSDGVMDAHGHGTNVSGIVSGVAPDTKVIGLDVFNGGSAWSSDITSAINWAIANKAFYNIVAVNMSLGDGSHNTSTCSGSFFASPVVTNAKAAGILSSIAAGNDAYADSNASAQIYVDGMSSPACVPDAVSVGAVYDSNMGGLTWGGSPNQCTDSTTAADKITCFSQSASYLTILAPGALITAGGATGATMGGTSQAAPHIAGAIAVLKGTNAFPGDTPDETINRMTSTGKTITDTRGGMSRAKPRIDLAAATAGGGVPTYSISGTVTSGGLALSGVTMTLSGAASRTTTTAANGNYSFTGLADGAYTVTPSKTSYTFSPLNNPVTISGADVAGVDFSGTSTVTYTLSGRVTTTLGKGLSGVTITLSGAASRTTTTDANGLYSFTGLANGTYTVTPGRSGYVFTPPSRTVGISGANPAYQNFLATVGGGTTTYSISGTVTSSGNGLSGVTMTLSGASSGTTTTDASGNYSFTGRSNGNYTVTPSRTGYTFTPVNRPVTINNANVPGQDFTATPVPTYSISGTVTSSGVGLSGVTMTLSGASSGTTTTDASGNYSFTGRPNGSYTVTPSRTGYIFTPTSLNVTINSANVTGRDFTASPVIVTYSISGRVTQKTSWGSAPFPGVTITLSGLASRTATTDASGNYSFSGLANGGYTVTPTRTGSTFTPVSRAVTVNNGNVAGQNFSSP